MIIGAILICIGLFMQVPGGILTTLSILDGKPAEDYMLGDTYSAIDEYINGDAYNYIIGSSLIAGKTAGMMVTKAIFIVGGTICICLGLLFMFVQKKEETVSEAVSGISDLAENHEDAAEVKEIENIEDAEIVE
jgi:hypothetical protein